MRCWNCTQDVPETPFCRSCGAALPDPDTRRAAITARLTEISTEQTVLQAQLRRLDTPAPPRHVVVTPAESAATHGAVASAPTPHATVPRPRKEPLLNIDVSPATVITLVGVVLLAAASFVSSKEHDALISLSHYTRLITLVIESVVAAVATWYLAPRRETIADATGSLTWAATLSLGLLATVNVNTGLRHDAWTYSLPFLVGALTLLLSRTGLILTRFVGLGTVAFGVLHLAYFALRPRHRFELVPMASGVLTMVAVSAVASVGLWFAFSARAASLSRADRYLALITVGLLWFFVVSTPLADSVTTTDSVLLYLGLSSLAVPFITGSVALARRGASTSSVATFGTIGGLLALAVFVSALVGEQIFPLSVVGVFSGSHLATLWFPVILGVLGLLCAGLGARVREQGYAITWRLISAVSLIPSLGSVAASLRWEFVGQLGAHRFPYSPDRMGFGWWGKGVTIVEVSPLIVTISGAILAVAVGTLSRATDQLVRRLAAQVTGLVVALTALTTVMRFTPAESSIEITALTLISLGGLTFFASRFRSPDARIDEWLPAALLGSGLYASIWNSSRATDYLYSNPGRITLVGLIVVAVLGSIAAVTQRDSWRGAAGASVIIPALTGIYAIYATSRPLWQGVLVALSALALSEGLSRTTWSHQTLDARTGLGLTVGGAFGIAYQALTMNDSGQFFRLALTLSVLALAVTVASRRTEQIALPVLLVPVVAASGEWAVHFNEVTFGPLWVLGVAAALGVLTLWRRRSSDISWSTDGVPSLFLAATSVLVVADHPTVTRHWTVLLGACALTVLGLVGRRVAPATIGAITLAVAANNFPSWSTAWVIVVALVGAATLLAGAQRLAPAWSLPRPYGNIVVVAGAIAYATNFDLTQQSEHSDAIFLLILGALLVLGALRRVGVVFEARFVLFAAVAVGLAWTQSFGRVAGPGLWLALGGVALLALTHGRDEPEHASWLEWGPSLALVMIPANYGALTSKPLAAAIAIGTAVALVYLGVQLRLRAVFDVAVATFALLSVARLTQVVSDNARWIVAVAVGVALVANGMWRDTRTKADGARSTTTSWYRSLR